MPDSRNPIDSRRRSLIVLSVLLVICIGTLLISNLLGYHFFVFKTLVIPILIAAAALSRRLRLFVSDWAIFLGLVALFDSFRGFIFAVITRFDLPVHIGYVIAAERTLLGGTIAPVALQSALLRDGNIGWFENLLVVVHASHFLVFLLFGMTVWMLERREFQRFAIAMVAVMYLGLLGYFAVPTAPPWMAANWFGSIPHITWVAGQVYNYAAPALQVNFDTNPVAAMPSLHAAFPLLCCLIGFHIFQWRALPLACYTATVAFAVLYLGEHYAVDVLAGWFLAIIVYILVFRTSVSDRLMRSIVWFRAVKALRIPELDAAVLVCFMLVFLSQITGMVKAAIERPFVPPHAFFLVDSGGLKK
jgi:membrane-associated phospholipid phosphatase